MPIYDIVDVCFSYKKSGWSLKNINMKVYQSEGVGIVGPNGAGKSTLIKLITGYYTPEKGRIYLKGRPLQEYSRKEMASIVGVLPQMIPEGFPFKVIDFVMMGRYPHLGYFEMEDKKAIEAVYEAMEETSTVHLKDRYIQELSGGERQRVFIARVLAQRAEVIVMDEPLVFLDITHQQEILRLLKELRKKKGVSTIIVSHNIKDLAEFSDRLILIKDGCIVSNGPSSLLVKNSRTMGLHPCEGQ